MFGWMNVDRGLVWYSRLLNLALKNIEDDEGSGTLPWLIIIKYFYDINSLI